jgi:hypothetical protein
MLSSGHPAPIDTVTTTLARTGGIMMRRLVPGVFVLLAASPLAAQAPTIEHRPVACVVAKRFPRLEAQFAPRDSVATARVLFQTGNAREWYSVAMTSDGGSYSGVLPKPKKSLKAFRYYIEMVDSGMGTRRTAEYAATVVGRPSECHGKMMAGGLASASVLLQVPAGAAVVPVGFEAAGVAAAGSGAATSASAVAASSGGGSGGLIAAGAGVLAAGAATAVVVATKGGGTTYQGPFNGQITFQRLYRPNVGAAQLCSQTETLSGTMTITLKGSDTTGSMAAVMGTSQPGPVAAGCDQFVGGSGGFTWGGNDELRLTGTPGNLAFSATRSESGSNIALTLAFEGALSGDVIAGALTYSMSGTNILSSGTSTFSGGGTFPVSLR